MCDSIQESSKLSFDFIIFRKFNGDEFLKIDFHLKNPDFEGAFQPLLKSCQSDIGRLLLLLCILLCLLQDNAVETTEFIEHMNIFP